MKKILTLVLDGFGIREEEYGNAIKGANTPTYDSILSKYPHSSLYASGKYIGLPEDTHGNKIVGYETMSFGKFLKQRSSFAEEFTSIDSLETNKMLKSSIEHVKTHESTFHLIGLMSDGMINSNINDTVKVAKFLKSKNVNVVVDFISDGVDVPVKSALTYIDMLEKNDITIASVCGRYYAMDKNRRWDRTKIYYDLVRNGVGLKVKEIRLAIKNCYIRDILDEQLPPIIVTQDSHIKDNDAVLWMNYEAEPSYQVLTSLFNADDVHDFSTRRLVNVKPLLLYPVDSKINATVLISEENDPTDSLGIYLSTLDISQARIADSQNYDYVTYHFNGKMTKKIPKCNTYQIEIPKSEEKYDYVIAAKITKEIMKSMEKDTDFILASLASADNISKTSPYEAIVKMIEFEDECLKKIIEAANLNFYTVIIVSTHGNLEEMYTKDNEKNANYTTNNVPFIILDDNLTLLDGSLANVAPTILDYMDIKVPESMQKNRSLIKNK